MIHLNRAYGTSVAVNLNIETGDHSRPGGDVASVLAELRWALRDWERAKSLMQTSARQAIQEESS